MAFTYDLSTDIGKVRLLIPDTVEVTAIFTDAEVDAALNMPGTVGTAGKHPRAAATLCKSIARNRLAVVGDDKVKDITGGASKTAAEWRAQAAELIAEAREIEADAGGGFAVAENLRTDFQRREYNARRNSTTDDLE